MLCLKAEALEHDIASMYLPSNFKGSFAKHLFRTAREQLVLGRSSSAGDGSGSSSGLEDIQRSSQSEDRMGKRRMSHYKSQLENDIKKMERQLEEQIQLRLAYANAIEITAPPVSDFITEIPDKAKELLESIAALDNLCLKLEEELVKLQFLISQEKNERRLIEYYFKSEIPSSPSTPGCPTLSDSNVFLRRADGQASEVATQLPQSDLLEQSNKNFDLKDPSLQPNKLSEQMVQCMRNIFICLADSSKMSSKLAPSDVSASPRSPHGFLSSSSFSSLSDSSWRVSHNRSPSLELHNTENSAADDSFDPFDMHGKVKWNDVGSYRSAVEVSSVAVGKMQLDYAAHALKHFRLLVEKLGKVNPTGMAFNEKLAFWINLYNALIMHAYLAYGFPKSDIKLFSLMQKVSYTVGGILFSAADIEYAILKMKPPAHRPQIQALVLSLHKLKLSEEQKAFGIDNPTPLVNFALSTGSYSSPAVKIFRPHNIEEELQNSLRDYIRASVGLNKKGKLLVPKLIQSYAKGIVEDSLLADWICRFLSPEQASAICDRTSNLRNRLLGARSFGIVPFDSRFRYLFLLEQESSLNSP